MRSASSFDLGDLRCKLTPQVVHLRSKYVKAAIPMNSETTRAKRTRTRTPLSRERVLRAAVALADERGADELTMRKLAKELGVEAMSLYNHVASKTDLL